MGLGLKTSGPRKQQVPKNGKGLRQQVLKYKTMYWWLHSGYTEQKEKNPAT